MNKENSIEFQAPRIKLSLEQGNIAQFETHGHSMIPLLHECGDMVQLIKPSGRLKVGDVALCFTSDERYVLHRVVALEGDGYVLRGDNCVSCEYCSADSFVIGVAHAFIRKGKLIPVASLRYRFYCRFRKQILKIWQLFWKAAEKLPFGK